MVFILKAENFYFILTLVPARHTLRLSTHRASTTKASTYRSYVYIRPPYRTSWEL